jgi:hypothetical protein
MMCGWGVTITKRRESHSHPGVLNRFVEDGYYQAAYGQPTTAAAHQRE